MPKRILRVLNCLGWLSSLLEKCGLKIVLKWSGYHAAHAPQQSFFQDNGKDRLLHLSLRRINANTLLVFELWISSSALLVCWVSDGSSLIHVQGVHWGVLQEHGAPRSFLLAVWALCILGTKSNMCPVCIRLCQVCQVSDRFCDNYGQDLKVHLWWGEHLVWGAKNCYSPYRRWPDSVLFIRPWPLACIESSLRLWFSARRWWITASGSRWGAALSKAVKASQGPIHKWQ